MGFLSLMPQMEKAKTFYDAKKQQNQDLTEKLKAMEQLQKENVELRKESERLDKELQQSILQAKESELSCRNLTSQVRSLEAQVGTVQWGFTLLLLLLFLTSVAGSIGGSNPPCFPPRWSLPIDSYGSSASSRWRRTR